MNLTFPRLSPLGLLAVLASGAGAACAGAQTVPAAAALTPTATAPPPVPYRAEPAAASSSLTPVEPAALSEPAAPVEPRALPSYRSGPSTRPFHAFAAGFVAGDQGLGAEIATPLTGHIQLRAGFGLLGVSPSFNSDGLIGNGQLSLENVWTSVDLYPFPRSTFHISPGITLHNDTHLTANLYAPGGTSFSLGDTDYTSDPNRPINGLARFTFGNSVAPRLLFGWGNMLPRNGAHLSFPVEFGFQIISQPKVELDLSGNGCDPMGDCSDINSNGGAQNIQDEVNDLTNDLKPLRVYPLFTIGVAYRFGRSYDRVR